MSGLLCALAFSWPPAAPVILVAFVPLLLAIDGTSIARSFAYGSVAGAVALTIVTRWLPRAAAAFFQVSPPAAWLGSVLLSVVEGCSVGALAATITWCDRQQVARLLSVPAALIWIDGWFPRAFPWSAGACLVSVPALAQAAALGGPLLLSGMVGVAAASSSEAIGQKAWRVLLPGVLAVAVAAGYGAARIHVFEGATRQLRVGLAHSPFGAGAGQDAAARMHQLWRVSRDLEADGAELIVWPEGSLPYAVPEDMDHVSYHFREWPIRTPLLMGAITGTAERRLNSLILVDGVGAVRGRYDKERLLPLAEYDPLRGMAGRLPGSARVQFQHGTRPRRLSMGKAALVPLICYEDLFRDLARATLPERGPALLVASTSDSWFRQSAEPELHLLLARLRAVETGLYLVRVSQAGLSAIVDPLGRVVARSATVEHGHFVGTVGLVEEATPYRKTGDWPLVMSVAVAVWSVARASRRWRRNPAESRELDAVDEEMLAVKGSVPAQRVLDR